MPEPWSKNYEPSGWNDPLDREFLRLMPLYNAGKPRADLKSVQAIAERALDNRVPRHVVVVGTNGKTSTAHHLAEMVEAGGIRTGLYTSPHIRSWTERIRIGLEPVDPGDLMRALLEVHEIAQEFQDDSGAVRFFDVLTITAERLFAQAGVEVGIFEAGIGGRLDATRVLEPGLTLLTSIGSDHEELLGAEPAQRLREKMGVVPPGGKLISSPLGPELEQQLTDEAGAKGLDLTLIEITEPPAEAPAYEAANVVLAREGAIAVLGTPGPGSHELSRPEGRFQEGIVDDISFIADVAHNPTAWEAFLDAVPDGKYQGLVAISKPRPADELAATLARHEDLFNTVITTSLTVRPAEDPLDLAAAISDQGIEAIGIADSHRAFEDALDRCRNTELPLLVFGSNYLVVDFLAWVAKVNQTK